MATCTQCGAELKPGTKFCENCGAKVSVPQPAAQPAAVPQPPVQPTQAAPPPPQPQASGGNPYAGSAPAAPQPRTNAANPYAGNAPGTPPQTGAGAPLYAGKTPPVRTACHAAATRRHGRQPLRQCGPRRQAQAPPRTNVPQADDPDRHPGDIPAYDHRNND